MKLSKIKELIHASVCCGDISSGRIMYAFGSDLMSDVLTLEDKIPMLITGLANTQSIRTAEMADIEVVVIARGKEVSNEMIALAIENNIILLSSPFSMFKICGIMYENGIKPIY
ncbi:MAG: hypothetical protein B7C24_06770 [Bacteroidetes bacterium 4572_77]|nr:MAG: hypothetical protein B7C24_06770 [Bacteroidetes bacterium 4572_77]